ncbi:MAG TPA: rhodanese-like domain-containing protein [Desulfomonilaceae bacterium]|nr:rhodanese-like domain-containing protein [Desulfomonilaceae bacterium]
MMTEPERIGPQETHEKLKAGTAILVCAYDSDEKFRTLHLEGAISLSEFHSKVDSLPKDQEIVFYCA